MTAAAQSRIQWSRRMSAPPPAPGSRLANRIAAQIATGADDRTIARRLRCLASQVAALRPAPAPSAALVPAPDTRRPCERLAAALRLRIVQEGDEYERWLLRRRWLAARRAVWLDARAGEARASGALALAAALDDEARRAERRAVKR